jgi:hypothetical protein
MKVKRLKEETIKKSTANKKKATTKKNNKSSNKSKTPNNNIKTNVNNNKVNNSVSNTKQKTKKNNSINKLSQSSNLNVNNTIKQNNKKEENKIVETKAIKNNNIIKEEKLKKRIKRKSLIIIVFLILLSSISVAYAYYRIATSYDETLARINASIDCIDISYSEENTISLENQYPITDEYALGHLTPVEVTVTNRCTNNIGNVNYTLALTTLRNATGYIEDSAIRTNIRRNLNNAGENVLKSSDYITTLDKI